MSALHDLATHLAGLREKFADWTIHQSESGRWLAIRGNVCIRAHNASELRDRIRRYLSEITEEIGREQA